jgi:Flp pilus assembly protein TadG
MTPPMSRSLVKQKGVAAVEMGIMLIPLATLVFGITELGRAFYQYNSIAKATRDAVRFMSGQGPDPDPYSVPKTQARCLVVYGNDACTGPALVPGLTTSLVNVYDAGTDPTTHGAQPTGSGVVNLVTVSVVGYSFTSVIPFVVPNLTFNEIGTTMRQVL